MQAIHIAAVSGVIDVVHHLITKYKIDPRSTDQVKCTSLRGITIV